MPPPLRSLLLAFALAASASGCGGVETSVAEPPAASDESELHRAALRVIRPKPTLGSRAAAIALEALGVPYRWGGASPVSGFDCSGLVHWAYGRLGIELPHSSYALYELGRPVARARMKPGDVLFFYELGHVGVYLGHGQMVHAPESGRRVEVVDLGRSYYGRGLVGARRFA